MEVSGSKDESRYEIDELYRYESSIWKIIYKIVEKGKKEKK